MLINKWQIVETINIKDHEKDGLGICLSLPAKQIDIGSLYNSIQSLNPTSFFAVILPETGFTDDDEQKDFITKLSGLFFLPSYYLVNYQPVVFVQNNTDLIDFFLKELIEKGKKQGFDNILVQRIQDSFSATTDFNYLASDKNFDIGFVIKNWISESIKENKLKEINLLTQVDNQTGIEFLLGIEQDVEETNDFSIANSFYEKQRIIEEANYQLRLKEIKERNLRFYLDMQKQERIDTMKWYHYEYDILPTWFKQVGHLIKVVMGKRSFKSLFNDNVKKYKD